MKVTIEKIERLMDRADVEYEVAKEALETANGDLLEAILALEQDGKFGPNAGRGTAAATTGGGVPATVVGQSYGAGMFPQTQVAPNFTFGADAAEAKTKKADKKKQKRNNGQAGNPGYSAGQNNAYWQNNGAQWQNGNSYGQPGRPYRYKDESTEFEDNAKRFFRWLGRVIKAGFVNYFEIWRKGERIMYFPVILFLLCLIHWVFWLALAILIIGLFCGCRYHFSGPHLGRKSVNDAMNEASDIAEEFKDGENPHN